MATLLGLAAVALACASCAGGSRPSAPALKLQREDLVAVSLALAGAEPVVVREVEAARSAWPLIWRGLPAPVTPSAHVAITTAYARAASVKMPPLLKEGQATSLTGPAAEIGGLFHSYVMVCPRAWRLIAAAVSEIEGPSPAGARFARENVALYIESVYDAHFTLAQIGKGLRRAYQRLGGSQAFGTALGPGEVGRLSATFSEANDRLHPHVRARLGS